MGKNKENGMSGTTDRASWNSTCDAMLIECLEKQKENGRMTSNSSWHSAAWVDAEKALDGSEKSSGGCKKTGVSCQNRWTAVRLYFILLYLISCSSLKRNMSKSGSFVTSLVLAGMMDSPVSLRQMKCGMHS